MITVVKIESDVLVKIDKILDEFHRTYISKNQAAIKLLRIIEDEKSKCKPKNDPTAD